MEPMNDGVGGRQWWIVLAVVLLGAFIGVGVWTLVDTDERNLSPAATSTPSATPSRTMSAGEHDRFSIPSVGLDVALKKMKLVGDVIDPPGVAAAYFLTNFGAAPKGSDEGTVFVAMHALAHGNGPGNYVIDMSSQRVIVKVGAVISVDNVRYKVGETRVVAKTDISQDLDLWDPDVPNRLVVVTCMAKPEGGRASDNVVIVAYRS